MCTQDNSAAGHIHYPKNGFLEGNLNNMFGKVCKWMGQCLGCIDVEFLDYNRCPLMCEVRRETDGRNTLQYIYTMGRHRVE
jgi:hypothetical protein